MDQATREIDGAEENIVDGITRFLAKRPTIQNAGDVSMLNPLVNKTRSNGVDHYDCVVTIVSNGVDETAKVSIIKLKTLANILILVFVSQFRTISTLSSPRIKETIQTSEFDATPSVDSESIDPDPCMPEEVKITVSLSHHSSIKPFVAARFLNVWNGVVS